MTERRTRVRRQSSEYGDWELAEAPPAPQLAGLVRKYVGFVERATGTLRRREPPSSTVVMVLNFGVPFEVAAPSVGATLHRDSFVARMSELPTTTAFTGTSTGIEVDFTPLGLHLFCDLPSDELPAPSVSLTELLGDEGRRLTEMLEAASSWEARFDLLDAVIERRIGIARGPTPSVVWAWRALEATRGAVKIGELADRLACSPRHLIDGFRRHVGVTPKMAARILRFEAAARLARHAPGLSLACIAADAGYHDQAHMTREFRELAGITPAAYRGASIPGFVGVPDA